MGAGVRFERGNRGALDPPFSFLVRIRRPKLKRNTSSTEIPEFLHEARSKILYSFEKRYNLKSRAICPDVKGRLENADLKFQTCKEYEEFEAKHRQFEMNYPESYGYKENTHSNPKAVSAAKELQRMDTMMQEEDQTFAKLIEQIPKRYSYIAYSQFKQQKMIRFIEEEVNLRWEYLQGFILNSNRFKDIVNSVSMNQSSSSGTNRSREGRIRRMSLLGNPTYIQPLMRGSSNCNPNDQIKDKFIEKVKTQYLKHCQFFRTLQDNAGNSQNIFTLFNRDHFDMIFDKNVVIELQQETPDTENMSIAYWSSVYNKRPDIKELALFLIMIHSIPPTIVDVERIFKISKGLETEKRSGLLASTKEMLTVLKNEMPTGLILSSKWKRGDYVPTKKHETETNSAEN